MFKKSKAVFFDIDGTLADLFPAHIQSYQNTLQKITGQTVTDPAFFSSRFQTGTDEAVWRSTLSAFNLPQDQKVILKLLSERPRQLIALMNDITPKNVLPHVKETLIQLKKEGKELYAVSGNVRGVGELILERTGLAAYFTGTFFSADSPSIKDKATLVKYALAKIKKRPSEVIMVGDSPQDLIAAKKNQMPYIGVATGLHSKKTLQKIGRKNIRNDLRYRPASRSPLKKRKAK